MELIARPRGGRWTLRDGSREVGIITLSHGGRHGREFFAAWSAISAGYRWSLGAFPSIEQAIERVEAFDADPETFLPRVHRVSAGAVDRRR